MRIVKITCSFLPEKIGGTEIYVYNLSKKLKSQGNEIDVVYIDSFFEKNASLIKTYEYNFEGINIFVIKKNTYNQKTKDLYFTDSKEIYYIFKNYLKRINPDIVHFHHFSPTDIPLMIQAVKDLSLPIILTYHTPQMTCGNSYMLYLRKIPCDGKLDYKRCLICMQTSYGIPYLLAYLWANSPLFLSYSLSRIISFLNLKGPLFTLLELPYLTKRKIEDLKKGFSLVDYFVAVCKWVYELLRKNGISEERIIFSPQGIEDIPSIFKKQKSDTLILGYIGRIYHIKGIDVLIKAILKIPKDYKIKLFIYGVPQDSSEENYLNKLKKLSSKDKRIEWKGKLNYQERFSILSELDLLLIPSRWLETGPLVLLESWTVGTPVIASDRGALSELITDKKTGLLFEPENYQQLKEIIMKIYHNPKILEELRKNIPYVRRMEDVVKEMLDLYNKAVWQKK